MFSNQKEIVKFIRTDKGLSDLYDYILEQNNDDPAHNMAHFLRVAYWGIQFAQGQLDNRSIVAAALLHDLVNVPKNSPERSKASEYSAQKAQSLLPQYGFEQQQTIEICNAIRDHSFSRGVRPTALLSQVIQDADRLESLGALGIIRTFTTGVRMGAEYFNSDDPWAKKRELNDNKYSVDHFFTKLLKLPDLMNTKAGREEALKRAEVMQQFLKQLEHELLIPKN